MAALELDPVFVKALKLLHSRSKDSAAQLKAMLDDVIAQRRGHKVPSSDPEKMTKNKPEDEGIRKRDSEKRNFEKIGSEGSQDSKKPRRESPVPLERGSSKTSSSEKEKEKDREKEKARKEKEAKERERKQQEKRDREKEKAEKQEKEKEKEQAKDSESTDDERGMDADDFAFDLGISCVVCRQFDVSSGNQLVECQECHSLYHQECHRPPVTEQDVNDPRFVWYCTRCSKSLKKMHVTKPQKPKPTTSAATLSKEPTPLFSKPVKLETSPVSSLPFRRMDAKPATSKETSSAKPASAKDTGSSKPLSGLASLAANLSGKTESAKPKSSDSSKKSEKLSKFDAAKQSSQKSDQPEKSSSTKLTSSKSLPSTASSGKQSGGSTSAMTSSAASADKRLQMMKKKAAAKLQEKKVHVK